MHAFAQGLAEMDSIIVYCPAFEAFTAIEQLEAAGVCASKLKHLSPSGMEPSLSALLREACTRAGVTLPETIRVCSLPPWLPLYAPTPPPPPPLPSPHPYSIHLGWGSPAWSASCPLFPLFFPWNAPHNFLPIIAHEPDASINTLLLLLLLPLVCLDCLCLCCPILYWLLLVTGPFLRGLALQRNKRATKACAGAVCGYTFACTSSLLGGLVTSPNSMTRFVWAIVIWETMHNTIGTKRSCHHRICLDLLYHDMLSVAPPPHSLLLPHTPCPIWLRLRGSLR